MRSIFESLKIGIPSEFLDGLDNNVRETFEENIKILKKNGCKTKKISLKSSKLGVSAYQVVAPAECSSNLSRYDGVRFGYRAKDVDNIEDLYKKSRSDAFGEEVKRRILIGTYALSAGYYDAYYLKAQKVRSLITEDYNKVFNNVDVILTPSTPNSAFGLNEKSDDPLSMYLNDIFTVPVNLAGLPAISVPSAQDSNGLPLGLQLIGRPFEEETIYSFAKILEESANFKNIENQWWIK